MISVNFNVKSETCVFDIKQNWRYNTMNNKSKIIFVAVVVGLLSFIFAVCTIIAIFIIVRNSDVSSEEITISTTLIEDTSSEVTTTREEATTESRTYYADTENISAEENVSSSYNEHVTEADIEYNDTVLVDNSYYCVAGTPEEAGVVMRTKPSSVSDKLGVLPEGSRVYVYSDDPTNTTGYVRVRVMNDINDDYCYVMKRYLRFVSTLGSYDFGNNKNVKYISYSTPSHAGVNLRSEPSSSSENICTIPEGEYVIVLEDSSLRSGYAKVVYPHPHAGEEFEGWVLHQYLVD